MAASLEPQCRIVILITFLRIARPRPRQCGPQNVQYLEFDHSVFGMLCSVYVLNVLHDWGKIRVFLPYFITCTGFIRFFSRNFCILLMNCKPRIADILTRSTPDVPNCCCSKGWVPYWSNPPFWFLTFGRSGAQDWTPDRPNITLSNLNRFSKCLHCWKEYKICYKTDITHLTLGTLLHYLRKSEQIKGQWHGGDKYAICLHLLPYLLNICRKFDFF